MVYWFLAGLLVLVAGIALAQWFVRANPAILAMQLRRGAGILLALLATLCFATGRIALAAPLGAVAAVLLGWRGGFASMGGGGAGPSPGQTSAVETPWLAMTLDHASGGLDGTVKQGGFAGRRLGELGREEVVRLLEECRGDQQSVTLLETYLDRVHPDWRQQQQQQQASPPGGGRMGREEALQLLGLKPGASEAQIREAHHRLMMKVHPDQGGSDYLAAKLNEAKDVLLG